MKLMVAFLGGVVAGAFGALLFAPATGEELRERLADEASNQWESAQGQLQSRVGNMQDQVASLQAQVESLAPSADESG